MFVVEVLSSQSVSAGAVLSSIVLLTVATVTDLRTRRVPNQLVIAGCMTAAIVFMWSGADRVVLTVCAAAITATILLLVRWIGIALSGRVGLGMGDIKLSFVLGLFIGVHVAGVLYLAACLAALTGLAGMVLGRCTLTSSVPFVPFMAAGAILYGIVMVV